MITLILIIIAAIANAAADSNYNLFDFSIFYNFKNQSYWNPNISWKNKYKDPNDLSKGAKFFGSKDFLIFLTDSWHLFKNTWLVCLLAAPLFYKPVLPYKILDFFLFYLVWGIVFEICLKLFRRK